jgi:hypothetical protein
MVNSIYAFAWYLSQMPRDMLPETTEGREGFVHPYLGSADVEQSVAKIILRDFDVEGLDAKERLLRDLAAATEARFPGVTARVDVKENYRNMKEVLKNHPELIEYAFEATRRAGIEPFMNPIRGGTDGTKLTFRGLPCPNLFTGGHEFHSKLEFNSRRGCARRGFDSTRRCVRPSARGSDLPSGRGPSPTSSRRGSWHSPWPTPGVRLRDRIRRGSRILPRCVRLAVSACRCTSSCPLEACDYSLNSKTRRRTGRRSSND